MRVLLLVAGLAAAADGLAVEAEAARVVQAGPAHGSVGLRRISQNWACLSGVFALYTMIINHLENLRISAGVKSMLQSAGDFIGIFIFAICHCRKFHRTAQFSPNISRILVGVINCTKSEFTAASTSNCNLNYFPDFPNVFVFFIYQSGKG